MSPEQRKVQAEILYSLVNSPAWAILCNYMDKEILDAFEGFNKLPAEQKCNKKAYEYHATYKKFKELKEWVEDEIRICKVGKQE